MKDMEIKMNKENRKMTMKMIRMLKRRRNQRKKKNQTRKENQKMPKLAQLDKNQNAKINDCCCYLDCNYPKNKIKQYILHDHNS